MRRGITVWRGVVLLAAGFGVVCCSATHHQNRSDSLTAQRPQEPPAAQHLERATNPDEARRWRRLRWQDEDGFVPRDARRTALQQRDENIAWWISTQARETAGISPENWVERGPDNVGGRTRALVIDPENPDRMWAGAVSGGIWVSEDAGASWAPVNDWMSNLAICCLAGDPNDPNIMYAGTGEGFFNGDAIGGRGIFRSVDRGQSWTQMITTKNWENVNRIAVSPDDGNVILAATRYGGIRRSTNRGFSWSTVRAAQGSFFVAFSPSDDSRAVAHVLDYDWGAEDWYHSALYSTDAGQTWQTAAGLDEVWGFDSRFELACARNLPNIVYASCAHDGKIWRSIDGGQSYSARTVGGNIGVSWYANPLWVDPTNVNLLVTGGLHFYRSEDSGVGLSRISDGYIMTDQPHVDNHYIVHDPRFDGVTNKTVYVCTDGGMWRTEDIYTASPAGGWSRREIGYRTTQFYGAAGDGATGLLIGGTQDNGTLRVPGGSSSATLMFGGDGGFCAIDPDAPNYCYGEYINLKIHRSTDGGMTSQYVYEGIADAGNNANFIAPFVLDPNEPNVMLAGGRSLWRSRSIKRTFVPPSWTEIRGPGSDNISAIAVAEGDSDVIWIGLNNGEVHKSGDGTADLPAWTAVDDNASADPLPNRYIERIVVDRDNHEVVYVALGGFTADNLWRTTDGGDTWEDISGSGLTGIPAAPINGLARHPQRSEFLYAGTEVGVFASADGGATWSASNDGPADVSVDELVFMHHSNTLLAATHGRGLFTVNLTLPPHDYDFDGDVDLTDYARFADCFTGPSGGVPPDCGQFDETMDTDVDLADYAGLQVKAGVVGS